MVFPKKEAPTSGAAGSALNNLVTFSLWQIILRMQEKLGNMANGMVLPYASITPQHDIYCSFCNYVMLFMHEGSPSWRSFAHGIRSICHL